MGLDERVVRTVASASAKVREQPVIGRGSMVGREAHSNYDSDDIEKESPLNSADVCQRHIDSPTT